MLTNNKYNIYNKKFPLHNTLAEEIIISYLLSRTSIKKTIAHSINIHFFTLKKYQLLYFHIIHTNTQYDELNIIKIIHKLWGTKMLQEIGGISYIINIIQKSQALYLSYNEYSNLKYFIKILHYYYIKRLFVQYSNSLIQLNYFYAFPIHTVYNKSVKYLNTISSTYKRYNSKNFENNITEFVQKVHKTFDDEQNILSGFKDLDRITNGFKSGDLIIVAGRPSMGKTSFAINILYYLSIKLNIKVHMFSLEMSKNEILDKLISLMSNITITQIKNKSIKRQDWIKIQAACKNLMHSPISIDDDGDSSIDYIKAQCKDYSIDQTLIIIDYLQLIKVKNEPSENRSQEIGNITRELKLLAQNIKSTVIILSQLNRNIENRANKRPLLSDLRESGCIDYFNLPYIQRNTSINYIETLHCFKKFYILNRINNLALYENLDQYIFSFINNSTILLCITHNHKLLTYNIWCKEDQIKYNQFNLIKQKNSFNLKFTIELNTINYIKRLKKSKVYDLSLQSYHNFIINDHIIHNSIEQDADLILMLYKNNEYIDSRIIDVVVAKHRHGPIGSFQLLFHADICKFNNIQNQASIPHL